MNPYFYEVDVTLGPAVYDGAALGPFARADSKIGVNVRFRDANYFAYLVPGTPGRPEGERFRALLLMSSTAPRFFPEDYLNLYTGNDPLGSAIVRRLIEGDWKDHANTVMR